MNWKKIILSILILGIVINPIPVVGQVNDLAVEKFSEDVSKSWKEAKKIWGQMYNIARSFWDQNIGWRVAPIWDTIKRWVDDQVTILKNAFREDTERVEEAAKEAGKSVSKSIWQMILEAIGIREKTIP
jgi:hypothetical protein